MRRIKSLPIPGLGEVRLQSLTAKEGLEVEFKSVTDGKLDPAGPRYLVAAMWLAPDGDYPRCRSAEDLEDMDYATFDLLYTACLEHRDYISPQDLAAHPTDGRPDSTLTASFADQTRPGSTSGLPESVSVSIASGGRGSSSSDANSPPDNNKHQATA